MLNIIWLGYQSLTDSSVQIQFQMEEQQNIHPNPGSPGLADVIRENINYQLDQSIKRTLLKESLLKISLDKDFSHLFEQCLNRQDLACTHVENVPQPNKQTFMQVSEEIRDICHWLEESEQFCGLAFLPFNSTPRLVQILHQKIEGTAIIVTEYPTFWITKMEEIGRLAKLKWGFLSANQQPEDKVRVLQLYELKKLKLLFITPSLFKCEQYHEFECDLLLIGDMHLYHNQHSFISKMIAKSNPNRVLGLYHTLMSDHYKEHLTLNHMHQINKPKAMQYNFIVLKTSPEDKFKNMMTYLSKNDFRKILIIVNKRQEAYLLNKKLLLEPKTSINLFDYLTTSEMNSFIADEMLTRLEHDKQQEKIFELIKRINNCDITIAKNTDFLRFCNFDIVIYFSFTDVIKFVESSFTTKEKLLLFEENDYHNYRNTITADFVTEDNLQKIVMKMVEKTIRREEQSKKRYYSDYVDDKLLDCYTISKQYAEKDEEKVIRINTFCRKYEISHKLFGRILDALEKNGVVGINYRTIYEIEIDMDSISRLKKQLPMIDEIRRKVNLLNVSTNLQRTIRAILEELKKEGIKYKITEEAVQIKILRNYEDIDWTTVNETVNRPVTAQALKLDRSFDTFKDCAYSSIELTRREKALQKKEVMLNFFSPDNSKDFGGNLMDSYHKSNLLTSEIEEWIRHSQEMTINEHDLILLLQGVEKGRISRFKDDPIYGRYRKLKYEQLMEAISKIYGNKKLKLQ